MNSNSLYRQVVEATYEYLGPAADRFISGQIVSHLDKSPEKLVKGDLEELIKWIKPAVALLSDDKRVVDEYINTLSNLSKSKRRVA